MDFLVVIPARYASSRLPAKPLIKIGGIPMLVRTYNQCLKAVDHQKVIVATDDKRIEELCFQHNMNVIITSSDCKTGTDRVAEVASKIDAEVYINVQGDEPILNPDDLKLLVEISKANPTKIINGYCEIQDKDIFFSPNTPKVVFDQNKKLLYMSRAGIPSNKESKFSYGFRQICIYAFPKDCIDAFAKVNSKTPIEAEEDIEIVRFLEMGFEVQMIEMSAESIPVDNPEDIKLVEKKLGFE